MHHCEPDHKVEPSVRFTTYTSHKLHSSHIQLQTVLPRWKSSNGLQTGIKFAGHLTNSKSTSGGVLCFLQLYPAAAQKLKLYRLMHSMGEPLSYQSHYAFHRRVFDQVIDCRHHFLDLDPGCFRTFIPSYLMRSLKDFRKIFIKFARHHVVVAVQHFRQFVTDVLWSSRSSVQ